MQRKPNLRHHTTQKNYVAIWYSIIFHFLLFVLIVNLAEIDAGALFDEMWENVSGKNDNKLQDRENDDLYLKASFSKETLLFNPLPEN